jgi:hypothetical protein
MRYHRGFLWASTVSLAHRWALGLLQALELFEACVADLPAAGSLAVIGRHSQPSLHRELGHVVVAAVAVAAVFRTRRCAAEVVESFRADLAGGLG